MSERRIGERHFISFPVRVEWKDEKGDRVIEEGLTENIGPNGVLIHLPRLLPNVGSRVSLTVTENPSNLVTVDAQVLRLERNVSHPQAAFQLLNSNQAWEKNVWQYAGDVIAAQKPDNFDDWN